MTNPKGRQVVVTGLGAVTPLGMDANTSWEALAAGRSCRGEVTLFDPAGCRCREAAEVGLPDDGSGYSRATRLAVPALREALAMAGLLDGEGRCSLPDTYLSISTNGGAMANGEEFFRRALAGKKRGGQFRRVARYQPQQQALDLQEIFGLVGRTMIVANACASGANAIGHGADLIEAGRADIVITGGYEALTDLIFTGFDCLQALSPTACRPFDKGRDGLMLGEGAAFLVLESAAHAEKRGAVVHARLLGYGHSTDLHHLTQPAPKGEALAEAIRMALRRGGVKAGEVGHINAHGTGTPMNDGAEAVGYHAVEDGALLDGAWVCSTKAAIGHTLGAAGALEAVFALQALRHGQAPPQVATSEPLPEMAEYLPGTAEVLKRPHVMSVNLGFGGSNAALLFGRAE